MDVYTFVMQKHQASKQIHMSLIWHTGGSNAQAAHCRVRPQTVDAALAALVILFFFHRSVYSQNASTYHHQISQVDCGPWWVVTDNFLANFRSLRSLLSAIL